MRQEGGFYAMKQHTDSREPGIGGEVFKEHHIDSREPGIGEEFLKLRSALFFEHRSDVSDVHDCNDHNEHADVIGSWFLCNSTAYRHIRTEKWRSSRN